MVFDDLKIYSLAMPKPGGGPFQNKKVNDLKELSKRVEYYQAQLVDSDLRFGLQRDSFQEVTLIQ
jgi:hypothetical protein